MFTWVCQRCGSAVDVAQTDCPVCKAAEGGDTELGSARGAPKDDVRPPLPQAQPLPSRQPSAQRQPLPPPATASIPSGPAPLEPPPDVFSLQFSHLLVFVFALLAAVAVAVFLSQPELLAEWRDRLTAPAETEEGAPVVLPEPGAIEVAGVRAWRDEKAELRVRAALVNHQMAAAPGLEYEVLLFARADAGMGRALGSFQVELEEPLEGRSSREVEAALNAPEGLADFPHWSELIGRVRRPQTSAADSGQ